MTSLVNALDSLIVGENGAPQYKWTRGSTSSSFEKDLVALDFMSVRIHRSKDLSSCDPVREYHRLVSEYASNSSRDILHVKYLIAFLFRLRDIEGKGEYGLFHYMLPAWDQHMDSTQVPEPGFVTKYITAGIDYLFMEKNTHHPYGSWKDAKYILNAIRRLGDVTTSPIAAHIISIASSEATSNPQSLVHRWLPREKSNKFGWQATLFAKQMFQGVSKKASLTKYRKYIANCNKDLHTTQILQCDGRWHDIDFKRDVTSCTMHLQKKAFLCKGSNDKASEIPDRIACMNNYTDFVKACTNGTQKMKSKRVGIESIVKEAYRYFGMYKCNTISKVEVDTINTAWRDQMDAVQSDLSNWIALVDTSDSMTWENCPLYAALGIGLRIAERSSLGKRIMTFSTRPQWMDLSKANTLTEMMTKVCSYYDVIGGSTNLMAAFTKIADTCVELDLHPSNVESLVFCILSDMQIDEADSSFPGLTLDGLVANYFREAGMKTSHREPYPVPRLVFWNMRCTQGFPSTMEREGTVAVSGYSPAVLDAFSKGSVEDLKTFTPWRFLHDSLAASRYTRIWKDQELDTVD
jgi:hypothetical protein